MNIVMRQGWIALGVSIAAMIGRPVKYSNKKNLHLWSSRAQNTKDWYHDVLYSAYVQYSKGSWSWTVLVYIQILILDNFFNIGTLFENLHLQLSLWDQSDLPSATVAGGLRWHAFLEKKNVPDFYL